MRQLFLIIACLAAACIHAQEKPLAAAVKLLSDSPCSGEYVLLGGIAQLDSFDAAMREKLAGVSISKAPLPGAKRIVSQQEVLLALKRAGISEDIAINGTHVTVTATADIVRGASLAEAAQKAVREHFAADEDIAPEIEIAPAPADLTVRNTDTTLQAEIPAGGFHPGQQRVKVRVMSQDRRVAEATVSVNIRLTGSVTVAARKMTTDDILAEDDLKQVRRELSASDFKNRDDAKKLIGMKSKKAINPGEPLLKANFAQPQVIKRGDLVTLIVRRGGLELATRGEAKTDAVLDESVRVLVLDSNAEITARASGPREATIDDPRRK
jgi:flagella basal body P-ring formation protein FlgA